MKRIVFIGSHLGYPMDRTPLGGGAMVGLQLARHWSRSRDFQLTVVGSGPVPPASGLDYVRLPELAPESLVRLSEFGYARFCRNFERETAAYLARRRSALPPEETVVVLNDISEGPDPEIVTRMGYPILSIWHVDVVDFFNKMYLRNLLGPDRLTRTFDRIETFGLGWAVPDVLRLVFDKQRRTVAYSRRLVVPSKGMAETIRRCYRHLDLAETSGGPRESLGDRIRVVPWGGWRDEFSESGVETEVRRLRAEYRLGPQSRVLMTMSRISPEKGLHLLLEALRILESAPARSQRDLCLFLCGEPAFMRGEAYHRRVRAAAKRLKRCRVFFPGYLPPVAKQAHFRLADIFVSPSIHESYGLSIVEAVRAGLPVLASDHSGVDEILSSEFSRIVPYAGRAGTWARGLGRGGGVPRRLAEALEDLLRDPAALKRMGRLAQEAGQRMSFAEASLRLAETALELVPDAAPASA